MQSGEADRLGDREADGLLNEEMVGEADGLCDGVSEGYGDSLISKMEEDGLGDW